MTCRLLCLGTGTGVGKTYCVEALARGLSRSHRTLALKPIESGYARTDALPLDSDAASLARATFHVKQLHPLYLLKWPASPHLAARREGVRIDLDLVRTWLESIERDNPALDFVLIETAGGAFSPLHVSAEETTFNVDLAESLAVHGLILVAANRLGAIHDVTSTMRALGKTAGLVRLIALSDVQGDHEIAETNPEAIRELFPMVRLLRIQRGADVPRDEIDTLANTRYTHARALADS